MMGRRWLLLALVGMLMLPEPARTTLAQEDGQDTLALLLETEVPQRDQFDLVARYRGLRNVGEVWAAPAYDVGDVDTFWVSDFGDDPHRRVSAELICETPGVYMWVEEGLAVDQETVVEAGRQLDEEVFPAVRELLGEEPRPGIDGDDHIYVLHAVGLGREFARFGSENELPDQVSAYSNQREMVTVNLDVEPDFVGSDLYYSVLAREFGRMVEYNQDPDEAAWLDAGLAALAALVAGYPDVMALAEFLRAPGTQLNMWSSLATPAHLGASFAFVAYARERHGDRLIRAWAAEPADGLASLDAALHKEGAQTTALDLFADWVVANAANDAALGDGGYAYRNLELSPERAAVDVIFDAYPVRVTGAAVNQFGAQYLVLAAPDDQRQVTLRFAFEGAQTTPALPLEPHRGRHVYWSNRHRNMDSTLTRAFDLRDVDRATLTFWAWYDIEEYRDYAYVAVSDDEGESWEALPATSTTYVNPNRQALGAGFTGRSGGGGLIPYPFIGVVFGEGLTVTEVPAGSPAAQAGLEAGDAMVAVGGMRVESAQDASAALGSLNAGDTVAVSALRAGKLMDFEVTLGAHPTRFRPGPPQWVPEVVDLSAYAGRGILVRFEYVTGPGPTLSGIAIDDIAINAINFSDDAESEAGGWQSEGWARMDNTLPQRFLVQLVERDAVRRLIGPGDPPFGEWLITVESGKATLLTISAVTPVTTVPGSYAYTLIPTD